MSTWNFEWNDAVVERLKQLRAAGQSASEIAKLLGCTKNAVIGKLHRVDGKGGGGGNRLRGKRGKREPKPKQPKGEKWFTLVRDDPPAPSSPPKPFTLSLWQLRHGQCRWPEGDHDFVFCAQPQDGSSPYCSEHTARAFNKPR